MKKQATLLIINLEKIYTMDSVNKHPLVFQHAFIAIHHERILAVGCGSWQEYADKDTRILDGRGHIAVPGFIEVAAQLSAASTRDGLR
ncbi:imidazolonepropionase, partial [[Clostridium] innocuum]|nr:imidazolonepropionase [[Clostridium] innocuum]